MRGSHQNKHKASKNKQTQGQDNPVNIVLERKRTQDCRVENPDQPSDQILWLLVGKPLTESYCEPVNVI